jgi:hypothetical protein
MVNFNNIDYEKNIHGIGSIIRVEHWLRPISKQQLKQQ